MRPRRRYYFEFLHTGRTAQLVKLYALGETPCKGREAAFTMLEKLLAVSPELPKQGWRLSRQEDRGLAD